MQKPKSIHVEWYYPSIGGQVVSAWQIGMRPHLATSIAYKIVVRLTDNSYSNTSLYAYCLKEDNWEYVTSGTGKGALDCAIADADMVTYFGEDAETWDIG